MNIKTVLKASVAAAALVAVAAPVVSPAEAGINNGNKNSLVINGQVTRQVLYANDGEHSDLFHTGGTWSGSRISWIASGQVSENVKIGGIIQMNTPISNQSGTQDLGDGAAGGETAGVDSAWGIRFADISFKHKSAGTFSIGQGNTASNGRSEVSLSGMGVMSNYSAGAILASGVTFWNAGTTAYSTKTAGGVFSNHDGLSRADRVRYDLPKFAGISLATSLIAGGAWDVGAGYSGKFGGVQVKAAAQYNRSAAGAAGTAADGSYSGSLAVKHDSGINAAVSYGKEDAAATATFQSKHLAVALGYTGNFVNLGSTAMELTYVKVNDAEALDEDATSWRVGVVQNLSAVGSAVYASYQRMELEDSANTNYDDISAFMAGAIVKF